MKNIFFMLRCPLFNGIRQADLEKLLNCIPNRRKIYKKGNYILMAGDKNSGMGILLSGRAIITKDDFWGHRSILSEIETTDLFAEAFSCAGENILPVSVVATEASEVLFLDYKQTVSFCSSACSFHAALIRNMLQIVARKNITLVEKMEHITKRTTRNKLLSYLSEQARVRGNNVFQIPFDRQELADYLAVDRSAMSSELSKMKEEGLLNFNKNKFELLAGKKMGTSKTRAGF